MKNKVWLGRYIGVESTYHALDPRSKLLMILVNVLMIMFISTWAQLVLAAVFVVICLFMTNISIRFYFKQALFLKYMYVFFIVFFAFTSGTEVLFSLGSISIYLDGIIQGIFYSLKMMLFVVMGGLLTFTTAPNELVAGARELIKTKSAEQFAFMTSLSIRLIPMILDEVRLIFSAQQSRGLDFSDIPLAEKLNKLMAIIIPAISNTIKRLTTMVDVMECRGYIVGDHRTSIHELRWTLKDTLFLSSSIAMLFLIIFVK
ncbi:MAG TPA: energy-coupling factor transporter transmembrane protein EcfT [Firmicutes bacterium]|nr:energy-coupling factor transporter transmembrane protein EcfT [Bacillota bacterium]